jgi:CubicO group peptidase (beta-lactamase class C family)
MKTLIHFLLIILLLANVSKSLGQTAEVIPQEKQEILRHIFQKYGVLGGSVASISEKNLHSFSYGHAFPDSIAFSDSTFLRIASISKMFTGIVAMQLCEEGKLTLDDDIKKFLDFPLYNSAYPHVPITIAMLLNHTSTLKDSKIIVDYAMKTIFKDSSLQMQSIQPLKHIFTKGNYHFLPARSTIRKGETIAIKPGKYFHYTNLNFVILAHIIETIEQKPFYQSVRERLLQRYSVDGGFIVQELPKDAVLSPQYVWRNQTWHPEADFYTKHYDSVFTSIQHYTPGLNVLRFSPQAGLRINSIGLASFFRQWLLDSAMQNIRTKMFTSSWKEKLNNNARQFDNFFKEWGLACHIISTKQEPFIKDFPWIGHIGRANGAYTIVYMSPLYKKGIIILINGMKYQPKGDMGFAEIEKEIIKSILVE